MIIFLSITHFFKSLAKCACKKVVRSEMCLRPSVPAVPTLLTPDYCIEKHTKDLNCPTPDEVFSHFQQTSQEKPAAQTGYPLGS